jgi:hypothetical protein
MVVSYGFIGKTIFDQNQFPTEESGYRLARHRVVDFVARNACLGA